MLYNNLSGYFRNKYGKRLGKICIDGGFTCPNRDGTVGVGGCIYCGERGAGEHISGACSIREQVLRELEGRGDDELFVAYFQNFTNTYAPTEVLKERYDAALFDKRVKVLAIGTRADCIDEERAKLIASYKERCDVWVELGLQSADDAVARVMRRGYDTAVFESAVMLLEKYGIPTVAHVIIGLPTDTPEGVMKTADFLTRMPIWGLKIHSIYVMDGTELADMYKGGEYTPPSLDEYCELAARFIGKTRADVIIHRITGDCPRDMLVAPSWNADKHAIIAKINEKMTALGIRQGSLI